MSLLSITLPREKAQAYTNFIPSGIYEDIVTSEEVSITVSDKENQTTVTITIKYA